MKTVDFSEIIEACDLKLLDSDKLLSKSRYSPVKVIYLTLAPGQLHNENLNLFFLETTGPSLTKFCM